MLTFLFLRFVGRHSSLFKPCPKNNDGTFYHAAAPTSANVDLYCRIVMTKVFFFAFLLYVCEFLSVFRVSCPNWLVVFIQNFEFVT